SGRGRRFRAPLPRRGLAERSLVSAATSAQRSEGEALPAVTDDRADEFAKSLVDARGEGQPGELATAPAGWSRADRREHSPGGGSDDGESLRHSSSCPSGRTRKPRSAVFGVTTGAHHRSGRRVSTPAKSVGYAPNWSSNCASIRPGVPR